MSGVLHHEVIAGRAAAPGRCLFMLHGLLGWGRNWSGIARSVVEEREDWAAVLVDLPGHGQSAALPGPLSFARCAADVRLLVEHLQARDHAILGHSFGGKVALRYAADPAAGLSQVLVIDSTPAAMQGRGEAGRMLEILERMPDRFSSRGEAVEGLKAEGIAAPVAQWVTTNLIPDGQGSMRWRFDLRAMGRLLDEFRREDLWDAVEHAHAAAGLHFVRGLRSDLLTAEAVSRLEAAPGVEVHPMDAGHWVHVERARELSSLIARLLPR